MTNASDTKLLQFASIMRKIPRTVVKCEVYEGVSYVCVNTKHARNIFRKLFPMATHEAIAEGLSILHCRLEAEAR